jgi:hypothetical protein
MASQIVFSSHKPLDPAQQRYAFFDGREYIPAEVLMQIKNPIEANEIGFFFYKKKEKIIGVTLSSEGYLSKIFTVSEDNITRIWSKKLKSEKFFICAEIKRIPTVKNKTHPVQPAPSTAVH